MVITNIARSVWCKKGAKPKMATIEDFLPQWDGEKHASNVPQKKQSTETMKDILFALAGKKRKGN